MGRKRRDATLVEWLDYGDNLLNKLSVRSNLYKEIKDLLADLNNLNSDPNNNKIEITATIKSLNSTKTKFKAKDKIIKGAIEKNAGKNDWSLWIARINQHKKDGKRKKLYIPKSCHEQIEQLSKKSGYQSPSSHLKRLSSIFYDIGIQQTNELFDLYELLAPFEDALKPTPSTDLYTEDREPEFSLLAIVKSITEELSRLGIKNYRDLSSINKKRRDTDKYAESINSQLTEMQKQLEFKDELLKNKNSELCKFNETVKLLEANKLKLQEKLRVCNNSRSNRKAQKLDGKFKPPKPL